MKVPKAYIEYLIQYHATRDFFECHELLEEYWKEHPLDGLSQQWVALIQVAVGQYHERRANIAGAQKMYEAALDKIKLHDISMLGLDQSKLLEGLEKRIEACKEGASYRVLDLPIIDQALLTFCKEQAQQTGLLWGNTSVMDDIVHRHKLRDRSDVIQAREEALAKKQRERQ